MSFNRYPHSGTISYITTVKGAHGVVMPGTLTTIAVPKCRVEVNSTRFIVAENGDRIGYALDVFCPLLSGAASIPKGAKFSYAGKTYTIVQIPPMQTFTHLQCQL